MSRGTCARCGRGNCAITSGGTVRYHLTDQPEHQKGGGSRACLGAGVPPREAAADDASVADGEHLCRVCEKSYPLTANGRIRSHLSTTQPGPDGTVPGCPGGSDFPLGVDVETVCLSVSADEPAGAAGCAHPNGFAFAGVDGDGENVIACQVCDEAEPGNEENEEASCGSSPTRSAYLSEPPTPPNPKPSGVRPDSGTALSAATGFGSDTPSATSNTAATSIAPADTGGSARADGASTRWNPSATSSEAADRQLSSLNPGDRFQRGGSWMRVTAHDSTDRIITATVVSAGPWQGKTGTIGYAADDTAEVMGADSGPGPSATEADAFLSDTSDTVESAAVRYFPARYDGSCDTCGADFAQDDQIRSDGNGGWEAEDCCGNGASGTDRPKVLSLTLPVRNGRYVGPHPETGKQTRWTRTTNFVELVKDSIALDEWKGRMTALGLVLRPDLQGRVHGLVQGRVAADVAKEERKELNGIVEQAKEAAGSKTRSRKGTLLHKYTEEVDAGRRTLEDVPDEFRTEVAVYQRALADAGYRIVPTLIERSVVSVELEVVGTFDRILACVRDQEPFELHDGTVIQVRAGDFVLGDVKSGANLRYAEKEIGVQEAVYAHAANENGVAVPDAASGGAPAWRWAPLPEFGVPRVREDVGVVMHVPYGEARCSVLHYDLTVGWNGALLCAKNRDWRRRKAASRVIHAASIPRIEPTPVHVLTWEQRFVAVTSRQEASAVYQEAVRDMQMVGGPAELQRLVKLAQDRLVRLSAERETAQTG